jgi:hypothetical protein
MQPEVQSALDALAGAVGQSIALDHHGECCLAFEGDIDIVISYSAPRRQLSIRAVLVADADPYAMLRDALELNYGQLPAHTSIALDPQGEALVLFASWDEHEVAPAPFIDEICAFVVAIPEIREHLRASVASPAEPTWQEPGQALRLYP